MDNTAEESITLELEKRSSEDFEQRPMKRARVALACQRCRTRKQKCDGAQDSCSTCTRLGLRCHYKAHLTPKPDQKKQYIAALEDRIADLENFLSSLGHESIGDDHLWKQRQYQFQDEGQAQEEQQGDETGISSEIREYGPTSDNSYAGRKMSVNRVLGSIIKTQKSPKSEHERDQNPPNRSELVAINGPMFASPVIADRLLDGWLKHLSTRYPVIHTPRLRELHARRDEPLDIFEESLLHLVYANAGWILETIGETGPFWPEQHYEAALVRMDAVLSLNDTRSVAYLLLMALFCLREKDPTAWTLAGLAVRLCIELGLHRKSNTKEITMERELEVRLFWACYYLDREMSVALARPPAIADNNMDVEFPVDINEDVDDLETLKCAIQNRTDQPVSPPTTLTPFIHFLRLRAIESKIELNVYRVDRKTHITPETVQVFLDDLLVWKQAIPAEYQYREDKKWPCNNIDVFMILYHKCVRLLLYPLLSEPELSLEYLKLCAEACAGICERYKRLHRRLKADYSPLSLQTVFLAGLTLIYCTWLAPRNFLDVSGAISDCNIMLYVMTERWPAAHKYRDVFEQIKISVTDVIVKGNHQATRAAGILDGEMTERCRALDQSLPGGARTDYSRMISDMASDQGTTPSDTGDASNPQHNQHQLPDSTTTPKLWAGTTIDNSIGHGQLLDFADSAFMSSLGDFQDFEGLTTEWNLGMWEAVGSNVLT